MANNQHITILNKGTPSSFGPCYRTSKSKSLKKLMTADGVLAYSRGNTTAKPVQRRHLKKSPSSVDTAGKVWTNKVWKRAVQSDSSDPVSLSAHKHSDEDALHKGQDTVPILKGPKQASTMIGHRNPATNQNWPRTSFKPNYQANNSRTAPQKDKRHMLHPFDARAKSNVPGAKRIKLNNTDDGAGSDGKVSTKSERGKSNLTDFAYRQISIAPTFRDHNSKRAKCIPTITKSRGLVRVDPKETDQVCKNFLRGECNNVHCTKRHDIPRSSATPVCSFFQKGGMCLRDDCPFLHIKVNTKADICKMFNERGYCDNPNCRLKHFRGKVQQKSSTK